MPRYALLFSILFSSTLAGAQSAPVTVEFFQGPIVSSNRVLGLGGAFISIAEGGDGHLINPVAFVNRYPYANKWFDWDFGLSWLNITTDGLDLDRSGRSGLYNGVFFGELGLGLKFGRDGVGGHARIHQYALSVPGQEGEIQNFAYQLTMGGLGYAHVFGRGGFTLGGIANLGTLTIKRGDQILDQRTGQGFLLGGLISPCDKKYRLGFTLRSQILTTRVEIQAGSELEGLVPDVLSVPGELGVGASYMFGARKYNTCHTSYYPANFKIPRPSPRMRRYLLITADLVLTGPSPSATGLQAFLAQESQAVGQITTASLRGGAEAEILADRLVLRAGSYYEPSRFANRPGRVHATGGADLHFKLVWDWKLSIAGDVSSQYHNFGLGLGFWH